MPSWGLCAHPEVQQHCPSAFHQQTPGPRHLPQPYIEALCAPSEAPFPASPSPCPEPCRGEWWRSQILTCPAPRWETSCPPLSSAPRGWARTSAPGRGEALEGARCEPGRGARRQTLLLPVPALLWPSLRGRQECAAGSQHRFLFLAPLLAPHNPPFPLPSLSGMSPAVVLGEKGIWGCKRGVMGSWVGAGTTGHRYGGKFGVLCPCPQSHSRDVSDPGAQTAR